MTSAVLITLSRCVCRSDDLLIKDLKIYCSKISAQKIILMMEECGQTAWSPPVGHGVERVAHSRVMSATGVP